MNDEKMSKDDRRSVTVATIFIALIIGLFCWVGFPQDPATIDTTRCVTEDAPGPCVWDATKEGNHVGTSFTVTTNHGVSHYVYSNGVTADVIAPAPSPTTTATESPVVATAPQTTAPIASPKKTVTVAPVPKVAPAEVVPVIPTAPEPVTAPVPDPAPVADGGPDAAQTCPDGHSECPTGVVQTPNAN